MEALWPCDDPAVWQAALDRYPVVIAAQGVRRLGELDDWYRGALPALLGGRQPPFVSDAELTRITEWKMARGVWRQRNLALVRSNAPEAVEAVSKAALERVPDAAAPITTLCALRGVGPATASAVVSAAAPRVYPFFDDLVAGAIPQFGVVDFTVRCYLRYAEALRERAARLGADWTPVLIERALWAQQGGKVRAII